MLVLTCKLDEKIRIGQDIVLTVVDIKRGKIRLGVEAPREVPIYRAELLTPKRIPLCRRGCCFECALCSAKTGAALLCAACVQKRDTCNGDKKPPEVADAPAPS